SRKIRRCCADQLNLPDQCCSSTPSEIVFQQPAKDSSPMLTRSQAWRRLNEEIGNQLELPAVAAMSWRRHSWHHAVRRNARLGSASGQDACAIDDPAGKGCSSDPAQPHAIYCRRTWL